MIEDLVKQPKKFNKIEAAKLEGRKPYLLAIFTYLRNDLKDEIPKEVIIASTPNYKNYKCRKSFFLNIHRFALTGIKKN